MDRVKSPDPVLTAQQRADEPEPEDDARDGARVAVLLLPGDREPDAETARPPRGPACRSGAAPSPRASGEPSLIAAKTTIGFGAPTKAGTNKAHGSPLGAEEIKAICQPLFFA